MNCKQKNSEFSKKEKKFFRSFSYHYLYIPLVVFSQFLENCNTLLLSILMMESVTFSYYKHFLVGWRVRDYPIRNKISLNHVRLRAQRIVLGVWKPHFQFV